jgi:RNA polymerase sigma-70 factor, ECF subfamily
MHSLAVTSTEVTIEASKGTSRTQLSDFFDSPLARMSSTSTDYRRRIVETEYSLSTDSPMKPHEHRTDSGTIRLADARDQFLGYVRKRIQDPELAEDILQDGLLRAVQAAPTLRDEERLIPWFYRVLQNALIDAYRRRGVEQAHVAATEIPDVAAEPEDGTELCACFEMLIPALKAEYADLIRTVELGGEAPDAAAIRLGITPNNLKVRRHRAWQALRRELEGVCGTCSEHGCLDCTCR